MDPLSLLKNEKIILASASPRRKQLLSIIGLKFKVIPSRISEELELKASPSEHVMQLAMAKAWDVASQVKKGLIIGADTIVVLNGKILGKPQSEEEAVRMLKSLSNNSHQVYTGFALVRAETKKNIADFEMTTVHFRELTEWEIRNYVATGLPLDKAGAYGIQDQSALFADRIEGCFYNVVGFPLTKFYLTVTNFLSEK